MNATQNNAPVGHDANMQNLPLDRAVVKDSLEAAIGRWNGSVSSLAREAGVSPSTVTRFLKDPATTPIPKQSTIEKIRTVVYGKIPDADIVHPTRPDVYSAEIVGEVRPGIWIEEPDHLTFGDDVVLSIDGRRAAGKITAYLVRSAAATGSRWPAGTKLIVDSGVAPKDGDGTVFHRVRGDLIEMTFREFRYEKGKQSSLTPPKIQGGDWVESEYTSPFSRHSIIEDNTDVLIGTVIAAVWTPPS